MRSASANAPRRMTADLVAPAARSAASSTRSSASGNQTGKLRVDSLPP